MQFPKSPLPQESQRVGHSYLEERYDPPLKSKYDVVTLTIAQDFKENSIFFNCLQTLQRFSNRCLHIESFPRIWLLSYEETKSPFHLIHLLLIWFNNQGETKEGNLGLNNGAFVITRAVALNDVLYHIIWYISQVLQVTVDFRGKSWPISKASKQTLKHFFQVSVTISHLFSKWRNYNTKAFPKG